MSHDDLRLFDVRTIERKLRKGLVSKKDYDKFMKALPDSAANAAIASAERGASDVDDHDVTDDDEG